MRWLLIAMFSLVWGCASEDSPPPPGDGGIGDDAGPEDAFVAPPLAVAIACPDGWQETARPDGWAPYCEPWAVDAETRCPAGEAWFPGSEGCELVGAPCPAGDLPVDLPIDRTVIFISTTAPPFGRDGSRENPFGDLFEAFAVSTGGELFALSKGRHIIAAVFPVNIDLWGACAAETELEARFVDEATGTITATEGAQVKVRQVTIVGPQPGLRVEADASLAVRDVIVRGSGLAGAWVSNGSFTAENFVVRDAAPRNGQFGRALQVQAGGTAEVRRAVFEGVHDIAVQVVEAGSSLVLEDVAIRDVTRDEGNDLGRGIEVADGATLDLERVVIEDVHSSGLFVGGGDVTATDLLIRGVREEERGGAGRGLHVEMAGHLQVTRGTVDDARELGIYGSGVGSTLALTDVLVRGTRPTPLATTGGRGIQVQWGIAATLDRVRLEDNVDVGFFIAHEGTSVVARDLVVTATEGFITGDGGRGLEVQLGPQLTLERAQFTRNHDIGMYLHETQATLHDVEVSDTLSENDTGWYGRGIVVHGLAEVTGARLLVRGNHEVGILVQGGQVTMSEVHVEDTHVQSCIWDCGGRSAGVGISIREGGMVTITNIELTNNALAGMNIKEGYARLAGGMISGHPVAIFTTADPAEALEGLMGVEFRNNERNFDARTLPLPEASLPGEVAL